jgi:hypothetical protein
LRQIGAVDGGACIATTQPDQQALDRIEARLSDPVSEKRRRQAFPQRISPLSRPL